MFVLYSIIVYVLLEKCLRIINPKKSQAFWRFFI